MKMNKTYKYPRKHTQQQKNMSRTELNKRLDAQAKSLRQITHELRKITAQLRELNKLYQPT